MRLSYTTQHMLKRIFVVDSRRSIVGSSAPPMKNEHANVPEYLVQAG